jgi:hypothetical protein
MRRVGYTRYVAQGGDWRVGYATEMNLRPQTLYGLADSPVALAAWMLDHDAQSYDDIAAAFDGRPAGNLVRDAGVWTS